MPEPEGSPLTNDEDVSGNAREFKTPTAVDYARAFIEGRPTPEQQRTSSEPAAEVGGEEHKKPDSLDLDATHVLNSKDSEDLLRRAETYGAAGAEPKSDLASDVGETVLEHAGVEEPEHAEHTEDSSEKEGEHSEESESSNVEQLEKRLKEAREEWRSLREEEDGLGNIIQQLYSYQFILSKNVPKGATGHYDIEDEIKEPIDQLDGVANRRLGEIQEEAKHAADRVLRLEEDLEKARGGSES